MSSLHRVPDPYPSRCVRGWNETRLGSVVATSVLLGNREYVQDTCSRMCRLNWIIDKCGCIWHKVITVGVGPQGHSLKHY